MQAERWAEGFEKGAVQAERWAEEFEKACTGRWIKVHFAAQEVYAPQKESRIRGAEKGESEAVSDSPF